MHHRATCRCGAVAFEVEGDQTGDHARDQRGDRLDGSTRPAELAAPPASPEAARAAGLPPAHAGFASVLWAVPRASIRMRPPEPAIGAFTYSGWLVGHRFCAACGMHLFGEEILEQGAAAGALPMAYVNRECLDAACDAAGGSAAGSTGPSAADESGRSATGADRRRLEPAASE